MKTTRQTILSVTILCLYGFAFVGCNQDSSGPKTGAATLHDDDHDHDDHDEHEHAAHGPNGGIMIELGGDAKAEWLIDDESELLSVMLKKADKVKKVEMKTTIEGKETVYKFEASETPTGTVYALVSPELATAVKMGKAVDTKLVITTEDGELTGPVEHHSH